jgi:hypothetical protein
MKLWTKQLSWMAFAIATQVLFNALPSQAASLSFSFMAELSGKTLSGSFTGENQHDDGQFNAWDLSAFNATWGDFTWDLSGLGGFRAYYEPGAETAMIDWIYAQQYQPSSGQFQTLGYTTLQQGVVEFSVSDLHGVNRLASKWYWTDGIQTGTATVVETPEIPSEVPPTSVPEPGVLLGLGLLAGWGSLKASRG